MEQFKKRYQAPSLFMAYNTLFALYMLVAVVRPTLLLTGTRALFAFALSCGVSALALHTYRATHRTLNLLHGMALGFFAWLVVSIAYNFGVASTSNIPHFLLFFCMTVPVFFSFLCFSKQQCQTQWKWLAAAYNLVITPFCAIGIYCFATGASASFPFLQGNSIDFSGVNLYLFCHYNITGRHIAFGVLLAFFMLLCANKRWVRIVFFADFLLLFIALSLTYSRTSMLITCITLQLAFAISFGMPKCSAPKHCSSKIFCCDYCFALL